MTNIEILTDGTIQGTNLKVDGNDETSTNKIVSINMYAVAPYKSKYSGENIPGYVSCSYEYATDKNTVERKTIGTSETSYKSGIGEKIESSDAVIRFVGKPADKQLVDLVDKITTHCDTAKLKCPSKDVLLNRPFESLRDKATDLGIKLEEEKK
jgi:hypothetical protein